MMDQTLVNRVANSGLVTINLEDDYPKLTIAPFDLKSFLFKELILKEKDFRQALKELPWQQYEHQIVTVYCSNEAIIPVWAYMLVASYLEPFAKEVYQGNLHQYLSHYYANVIAQMNVDHLIDQKVVIKGCSDKPVPSAAYLSLTHKLRPIVASIMYGEPCSTVPIYKRKIVRS